MQLLAVRLARVLALIPPEELNPRGRPMIPDLTKALLDKYHFLKFPKTYEEYDEKKGIVYADGRLGDVAIEQLLLFQSGVLVDTRSSTDDSERILEEILTWAVGEVGITYQPSMIKRRTFLSELTFSSDMSLNALNPNLKGFSERLTAAAQKQMGRVSPYETTSIALHLDATETTTPTSVLRIERVFEIPFSENKFYSVGPLQTDEHIKFLEDFEAALK